MRCASPSTSDPLWGMASEQSGWTSCWSSSPWGPVASGQGPSKCFLSTASEGHNLPSGVPSFHTSSKLLSSLPQTPMWYGSSELLAIPSDPLQSHRSSAEDTYSSSSWAHSCSESSGNSNPMSASFTTRDFGFHGVLGMKVVALASFVCLIFFLVWRIHSSALTAASTSLKIFGFKAAGIC